MEVLAGIGVAASILQVADGAMKTSLQLYDFFSTITQAPQEILGITKDVNTFHRLVSNLTMSLQSSDVQAVVEHDIGIANAVNSLCEPINNCSHTFEKIEKKLRPHLKEETSVNEERTTAQSASRGNEVAVQPKRITRSALKWYFRRKEINSLLIELERNKATFGDAMGSVTLLLSLKSSTALKAKPGGKDMDDYTAPTKKIFDDDAGSALTLFAETTSNLPLDEESTSDTLCDVESTIMERDRTDIRLPKEVIQAIKSGSLPLVESLLDQALLNAQDCNGRTPLSFAAEIGHVMIAKLLLIRGASVSIRQYSIHSAQGMSNPYKYSGRTPLHWAAEKGHLEVVHLLLQYGANPNARSTIGRFPLLDATMNNHLDVAKLLIEYNADINASSFYGWTAMHAAAVNGRKNFMKLFIDHKASCDMMSAEKNGHKTPLHAAVIKRQRDVANMLLEHGADVNAQMVEDVTPLHLAAASGWQDGVSLLLRFGALTDARDAFLHETALHKAARNRRMRAIEMLCKRGANEKAKNIDGQTYHSVLVCSLENPGSWNVSEEDASIFSSM